MALEKSSSGVLEHGHIVLDPTNRAVTVSGKTYQLTPKECQLLAILMQHPGEMLTRRVLMQEVWDTDYLGDTRTLDVHICWLRQKIEADHRFPRYLLTIRGYGYMLATDQEHRL